MIAALIEQNWPKEISPFQIIAILIYIIIILAIACLFDISLFFLPIWYEVIQYRLINWYRKLTFQKPYVISRPELFTGGGEDDWTLAEHYLVRPGKVTTSDIDLMFHKNNARYLTAADHARFEWLHASGLFHACWLNGLSLVTASQTIRYRRELPFGKQYRIVTRCVGWEAKALYLEHLFMVKDDIYAILEVREGIAVPKKMKEKIPMTAKAPLTYVMRNILKWNQEQVPDEKKMPEDVTAWAQFLIDNSQRVTGFASPLLKTKKNQ